MMAGADRGKTGTVLAAFPAQQRIVVAGMNVKKKHVRPRTQGQKGELVRLPMPFPASRAAIVCGKCGTPVRIGHRIDAGRKIRICRKCGGVF